MPPLEPGLLSAFMSSAGFWLVCHLADTLPAQTQAHRVCSWEDMTGLSEPRCPMLRCCMTISRLVLSGFVFFFLFFFFYPHQSLPCNAAADTATHHILRLALSSQSSTLTARPDSTSYWADFPSD